MPTNDDTQTPEPVVPKTPEQLALEQGQQDLIQNTMLTPETVAAQQEVAETIITPDQLIPEGTGTAQPTPGVTTTTVAAPETAEVPTVQQAEVVEATTVSDQVSQAIDGLAPATAQPSPQATVQGQLESLMADFEGGGTPPWASGAMRQAMGVMQSRGLGASSIAGQAVVQAAMESATAIASQDASTFAQFEITNLNNTQQTSILKTQQTIAGLFSDQAAVNAATNINAASKNQMTQFFANLEADASKFNAAQINAVAQFNAGETNAIEKFNTTISAQLEQFNAQNALVISQANAQWRQQTATATTAAQNMSNLEYTKTINSLTGAQLDQIWQRERDLLDFAFTSTESAKDRASAILLAKLGADSSIQAMKLQDKMNTKTAWGNLAGVVIGKLAGIT